MIETVKFKYQELIDLKFERENINDVNFEKQHGYRCFYVTKHLTKNIVLDWDSTTQEIQMVRYDKERNVLNRWQNMDKNLILNLIDFYGEKKTYADYAMNAC